MATTKGTRSYDVEAPQKKVATYYSAEYYEFSEKKAHELAAKGKLPYCSTRPAPRMKKMTSRAGTEFEIDTTMSFLDDKHKPEDRFILSYDITGNSAPRDFSNGQMEAARKILWRSISPCLNKYKHSKQKWQYIITPACFGLLSRTLSLIENEQAHLIKEEDLETPKPQQAQLVELPSPLQMTTHDTPSPQQAEITDDDQDFEQLINDMTTEWPTRYADRFRKWYIRRILKFNHKNFDFDQCRKEFAQDCYHHCRNWHNGLKKALMKDKLIDKTRLKLRKQKRIGDAPGFTKIAEIDPKTCQLNYNEKEEIHREQGDTGQTAENLESTSVTTSSANITFVDERPVDEATLHTTGEVATYDVHKDIAEYDWTLNKVLTREYPIKQFEWKVGDQITKKLINEGIPKILTDNAKCMITRQLRFFSFMRAGVKIRIQINGTKFHCGRLIAYFKPLTWNDDLEENFYSLTCFPHCFLDASISNSGEIHIPFTHLLTHFSQESGTLFNDSTNSLGSLNIRPFNPLQAADKSSQSLFGQIYVSLDNPSVHLPTYDIKKFSYGDGYMQGLEALLKKGAGQAINTGLGLADKFTGGLVTGAGDAICNLLGICDKPLDPVSAAPMINRTIAPLCHGAGLDRSTRLGLSPIAQTNTSPNVLGATDGDFDILTLCKMPCLLEQVEWNTSQGSGNKLFDMLVTPTYLSQSQYQTDGTGRFANYSPTMLAYCSRGFVYYRGTLKVRIQVIGTQFHSGRLGLVYDPHGNYDVNLTDFEDNKSHNLVIMDIQEQQELTVDLPYFAVKPWLRCDHFRSNANLTNVGGVISGGHIDCDASGIFRIYVLNNLVRPDNVTDKIQINVFFYAGDNFELSVPNTVAPLSVRKGPAGIQYPNMPRYPYCKTSQDKRCKYRDEIITLYESGKKLFAKGYITGSGNWYDSTQVIDTDDVLTFTYSCKLLKYFMETADKNCTNLINNLPKYFQDTGVSTIDEINKKATTILGEVGTLDAIVGSIDRNVTTIQQTAQQTLRNSVTAQQALTSLEITSTQINNTANKCYNAIDDTREKVVNNTSLLGQVQVQTQNVLKAEGCFEQKIRGGPLQQIQWKALPTDTCEINGTEQGLENYTTTRENEGGNVTITSGNQQTRSTAPDTTSENSMNLQTVLRRYYPMYVSGEITNSNQFTLISIPVSPSFVPNDTDETVVSGINRRYDVHNLAWFSRLFNYNRGSLRYKLIVNADDSDIYVWHNPTDVKNFAVASGFEHSHLCQQMCFAGDMAVTRVQQGLEVEVPFYSSFNQIMHSHISNKRDLRAVNGTLFLAVRNKSKPINISIFISTGDDFFMNVLRAPPVVHEPAMNAYVDLTDEATLYPEFQRSSGHNSTTFQAPGTEVFDRWHSGSMDYCKLSDAPTKDFRSTELPEERQQMTEQMNVKDCVQDITGITEMKEKYTSEVKPILDNGDKAISEMRNFLREFKEDILPAILGHAKLFHRDVNETQQDIKAFIPKINEALEHLNALMITSTNTAEIIGNSMETLGEAGYFISSMFRTLLITSIWMNVIELMKGFKWINLINVVCLMCSLFKVQAGTIIEWIYSNITKMYEDYRTKATNGTMSEQGFEEFISTNSEETSIALAAIATVIYCACFGQLPKWTLIKDCIKETISGPTEQSGLSDFLRSVHFSNLGMKAIYNAFDFFKEWIDKAIHWFLGKESKEIILEKEFKEKAGEVGKWIDDIAALEDEDFYQLALTDLEIHNRFYRLADQGQKFTHWIIEKGVSRPIVLIIRDATRRLNDMIKRIKEIRPGIGFRFAPFVVMLDGQSSIAKTNVMHKFTDMFREELDIPIYNSVFAVPTTAKYLDGYNGQTLIEWDDMLQCPDQDTLVAEFINWRSNADFIVNKAKVEEKGMHFVSKAITITTNNGGINLNTIREMDAFRNRINIKFQCFLAPEWNIGRIKALTTMDPEFTFLRFRALKMDPDGRGFAITHDNLTYRQAIELARLDFRVWKTKQDSLVDEYLLNHGSLRIPRGVQIEQEEIEEEVEFLDAMEQSLNVRYRVRIDDNLTEEERIDAEIFQIQFEEATEDEQHSLWERSKSTFKRIGKKASQIWTLLKQKLNLAVGSFLKTCKDFYANHPNLSKALGIISMIGATSYFLKSFFTMIFAEEGAYENPIAKPPTRVIRAEGTYNQEIKGPKKPLVKAEGAYNNEVKSAPKRIVKAESAEQGSTDPEAVKMARNKIHPLISYIGWQTSVSLTTLQCISIGGKVILTPHHFFRRAKTGDFFYFLRGSDKILIEFVPERMFRIREKDACLYYLGPQADSRKNILNCFVSEKHLGLIGKSVEAILVGTTPDGILMEKAGRAQANVEIKYKGTDDGAPVYTQNGWKYDFHTLDGECGSPLIACSKVLPPPAKIVGIHTAGYTNNCGGFSVLLTREMIEEALSNLRAVHGDQVYSAPLPPQVCTDEDTFNEQVKIKPEGSFSYYGTMDRKFCPSQPMETTLRPTPFQGELHPVTKKPAMLKNKDGVSPLRNALKKYGVLTKTFRQKHIRAVKADMLNELMRFDGEMKPEPCGEREAIFGIDGMPFWKRMCMKSSPGWPYQCMKEARGQVGKSYLFDEETQTIRNELLAKNLHERRELAKLGERYPSVWRDCMKDELRPNEKVDAGKTRLFTIAPVDYTILCRQYFASFVQMFYQHHGEFFSAVGINPESYEWTKSYNRLKTYGRRCVAGDFSSFDGTLMAELMAACGEIIDDWYKLKGETDPTATMVRKVLIDEMIHTVQLVQNCVYKTHQGNPSGNPLTVIINTMVNAMYMRLTWLEITAEKAPALCSLDTYHQNVLEEIYGDDNRLIIKEPVIEIFNQITIAETLSNHGITYTDELKSSDLVKFKDLLDTSFLKRRYRYDPEVTGMILPAIDTDTIYELTNWYRKTEDVEDQLQQNQRSALDFAFFHGRDFYENFNDKLMTKMREHNLQPVSITYDEQLDRFLALAHGDQSGRKFMTFDN